MTKIDNFKEFKFSKIEQSKKDQVYLHLMYAGGDADTEHPVSYPLGIKFSEYKEHLPEIYEVIDKYKRLQKVCGPDIVWDIKAKKHVVKEYQKPNIPIDDDLEELMDEVPNDPQSDYQFKCYLDRITLVAYDENGDKYESYV